MTQEIWKEVKGYEEEYCVSNQGRIRSLDKIMPHWKCGNRLIKGRVLRPVKRRGGYCYVNLASYGKIKMHSIHRLVAEAFILNTENKLTVNHKNGIKTDNRVENLEWASLSENLLHAFSHGLCHVNYGEDRHNTKLSNKDIVEIKNIYKNKKLTGKELAKKYACSPANISLIVNNKSRILG